MIHPLCQSRRRVSILLILSLAFLWLSDQSLACQRLAAGAEVIDHSGCCPEEMQLDCPGGLGCPAMTVGVSDTPAFALEPSEGGSFHLSIIDNGLGPPTAKPASAGVRHGFDSAPADHPAQRFSRLLN